MKQGFFAREQFRKYLLYALGEMVLVVIGILIALQIDNWNTEQEREESLASYLGSIARNVRNDLVQVKEIRAAREATFELAIRENIFISERRTFDKDQVEFASYAIAEAQKIIFFNASTSGYEALKSSGVLEQLQGRDIEQLLYDYYDTVGRILLAEQNHNDYLRQLSVQLLTDWPEALGQWAFLDPGVLTDEHFETLLPAIEEVLHHAGKTALILLAQSVGELLSDYERLEQLGSQLVRMTENGATQFDDLAIAAIANVRNRGSRTGRPDLIVEGQTAFQSLNIGAVASIDLRLRSHSPSADRDLAYPLDHNSIGRVDDALHFSYRGGAEWAVIFFPVDGTSSTRASLDFSMYDKLQLEMKGDSGGERVWIHMKDSTDPDDGSQTDIEVVLTDQWQSFEIDLDRFENADLDHLHIPLGFLFDEQAVSFSVRSARFTTD